MGSKLWLFILVIAMMAVMVNIANVIYVVATCDGEILRGIVMVKCVEDAGRG